MCTGLFGVLMCGCGENTGGSPCGCEPLPRRVTSEWKPSTTVNDACDYIRLILGSSGSKCDPSPCREICRMLRMHCNACGGTLPIPLLAMLVASDLMMAEAIAMARVGTIDTLSIKRDYSTSQSTLRLASQSLKAEVEKCRKSMMPSFGIVGIHSSCRSHINKAYTSCGCPLPKPEHCDVVVNNCNFDCCDDCECDDI